MVASAARAEDEAADGVSDAASDAAAAATAAADAAAAQAAAAADAAAAAAANASAALSGALGNAGSSLGSFKASAGSALGGVTSQAGSVVGGAAGTAGKALGGAAAGAGSALGKGASVVGKGAGVVGEELGAASKVVGGAAETVAGTAGSAASAVSSSVNQVTSAVTGAATAASDAVGAAASGAVKALEAVLPPEFASIVSKAEGDADTAAALVATVVAVPFALTLIGAATRGYAGEKRPFVVDEELRKDSRAFIVDTRSEATRRADGVPDLRESQRGKGAAVEITPLGNNVRGQVNNPRAVELELAAIKVKALTKSGARVYVMGPDAAALAKAVTTLGGCRAYVLAGGFDAWRSSGLKVRSNGSYEKSALDVLGEDTSATVGRFTQKVSASVGTVQTVVKDTDPVNAAPVVLGAVALAAAAYNYETSLQYAGVIGIELTILSKLLSYESPMDLLNDVKDSVGGAAAAVSSFEAPAFEMPEVSVPSTPSMPSMPAAPAAPATEKKVVEEEVVAKAVAEEVVEKMVVEAEEVVVEIQEKKVVVAEMVEVVEEVKEVKKVKKLEEESTEMNKDM